jgi:hydroxymethylglutaryl-CoA lyase/(R)-citramalyl-CoA lyase
VRAELVSRLAAARLPRVEAVSFVRDDLVPQMAGAEEVVAGVRWREGTELSGLVLNERGYERLAAVGLDRVNCTLAATESFNRRNGNASLDEAVERVRAIVSASGRPVTVTISCSFGCPFEGEVDPARVADLCERLAAADELVLADTIGVATPRRVRRLVGRVAILGRPVGAHLHNTRNTGYAAAWAALEAGAEGPRHARSAAWAAARSLRTPPATSRPRISSGSSSATVLPTGVDLDALVETVRWLAGLLGREPGGQLYRAAAWPPSP